MITLCPCPLRARASVTIKRLHGFFHEGLFYAQPVYLAAHTALIPYPFAATLTGLVFFSFPLKEKGQLPSRGKGKEFSSRVFDFEETLFRFF